MQHSPIWTRKTLPIKHYIYPVANSIYLCGADFTHYYNIDNWTVNSEPYVTAATENGYTNGWGAAFARKTNRVNLLIGGRTTKQGLQRGIPAQSTEKRLVYSSHAAMVYL